MINKLRIFKTPGRFRLTTGCQLLPTSTFLLYSPQNKFSNATKTFLSSQPSTRCIQTAKGSFEADKLCSEIGIQNLAGKETAAVNETSSRFSERSHQAPGNQGRVSSAGKGQRANLNWNKKQEQRKWQRQTQQQGKPQRQQQRPQDQLPAQAQQQTVDQMNPNHFGYQSGYPPIYQGGFVDQRQQQQSQQHQDQQWFPPQQEQYGMGYAPPPGVGYGFVPPAPLNTFPPGMTLPHWQQPPPPFYSGAGRRAFNTNTNNTPQLPQAAPDYYRPRSPIDNSRGGQYNNYNISRPEPDYYRPRSPGPYSGGRRYNNNTGPDSYRPGPYSQGGQYSNYNNSRPVPDYHRPRSPRPNHSREYSTGGQYRNISYSHQQQQRPPTRTRNASKPPKLNKKAKAREAAAREALSQAQAQASMMPTSLFNQRGDIPREASDPVVPPSRASGGIPKPSQDYLSRASFPPRTVLEGEAPRPMLVVIDLNGTLLHRPSRRRPSNFVVRPFANDFLRYCLEHFSVVIWSSARPVNVDLMCKQLLTAEQLDQVVAIWGRDKFGLTQEDYNARVQCYKRLTMLWGDATVRAANPNGEAWDQGNTVLIDDSAEKARSEPYNCITLPEFVGNLGEKPQVLPMVLEYLDTLAHQEDISRYIRVKPFDVNVDSKAVTGDEGVALASPPAAQAEGSG
ncbi:hypothetical protein QBC45DRAFT_414366 [Copromyces sp. CBS 386.78]|nr:hypothetical protein QBC45DRAFT_414366 [Copromyces sp. CBS 386.78]